ncbi:BIRC2_3 [Mytilus edulis]|uniref:BIRC2_3 n=1 Tax=Mytilus edulis TaxID=6550 RepID=A0A8S3UTG0_MYTED|nr:BIRC2_3 [Mytilus edulis]
MADTTNCKQLTSSVEQKDGDQTVNEKKPNVDIFVLYDESDDFTTREILDTLFHDESISYRCLDRHGDPGNTIFDDFKNLLLECKKVLFVISKEFNDDDEKIFMVKMALDLINHDVSRLITLFLNGEMTCTKNLWCLNSTLKLSIRKQDWKRQLLQAIKIIPVDYCSVLETGNVSDYLLLRGLTFVNLRWNVYGVLIVAENRYLKVELLEYSKHLEQHHAMNTLKACEQCGFLSQVDTTINLSFRSDFSSDQILDIKNDLLQLCVSLLNTRILMETQTEWLIVCSITGLYGKQQQNYVSNFFAEVKSAIETNYTTEASSKGQLHLPEYADEQKRRESFEGVWPSKNVPPAEVMSKSGFVFMMKPDVAQCFSCGYNQCLWEPDKDPLFVHAQVTPSCNFVKENVPPDKLPSQRIKCITKNDAFSSEDSRLISLRNLKISDSNLQILESEEDVTRQQLAKAGFYFIGYNMVKCFSCGISVSYKGIETESDIWNMHATLSPNCEHLLEQKGSEFINAINSIQKRNMEPTIVTLFLLPLKGEQSFQWPGYVFLPGERYKLQPIEL